MAGIIWACCRSHLYTITMYLRTIAVKRSDEDCWFSTLPVVQLFHLEPLSVRKLSYNGQYPIQGLCTCGALTVEAATVF